MPRDVVARTLGVETKRVGADGQQNPYRPVIDVKTACTQAPDVASPYMVGNAHAVVKPGTPTP